MSEKREPSEKYASIAAAWIRTEHFEKLKSCTIIYLESEYEKKSKGKIIFGTCERVSSKNQWAIPADFTITFYRPHMALLTPEQQAAVVFHELMHVGYEGENEPMKTIPHDIEDFKKVIDMFGSHWNEKDQLHLPNEDLLRGILEEAEQIMITGEGK